ncbi:MAG: CoA-binding protein [Gemmobacter sp.]
MDQTPADAPDDDTLRAILTAPRVVAVVGFSANPARASQRVARFLAERGMRVIPVNPGLAGQVMLGETAFARLQDIPAGAGVEMVDIFRRSEEVGPVVDAALAHLPDLAVIWMQLGVRDAEAAARARARGVTVIQDRCPKIEIERLLSGQTGHQASLPQPGVTPK